MLFYINTVQGLSFVGGGGGNESRNDKLASMNFCLLPLILALYLIEVFMILF